MSRRTSRWQGWPSRRNRDWDGQTFEAANAKAWRDEGSVFTNANGGPIEPGNVLKRFKATLAAADLPQQRFHDLRTTLHRFCSPKVSRCAS